MPKLPTFTAPQTDFAISGGRRASADDAGADVFGAQRSLGRTIQSVADKFLENTEATEQRDVMVSQAKIRQRYAKELEDAEISGADVDQIRQRLENELGGVGAPLSTKRGAAAAEMHGANTLNVFDSAVNGIKVRRAATQANTAAKEFVAAQAAILNNNPSYLPFATDDVKSFLETYTGSIPPEKLAEMEQSLRQQMNVSAVSALIRLAPEDAKKRLEGGEFFLSPEQRVQEVGRAETQIRALRAERAAERAEAEFERQRTSDSARDEWFREIMNGAPGTLRQIIGDLRLTPEHREHLVVFHENWLRSRVKADRVSDPNVVRNLMLDVHAPEGSDRKIYTDDKIYAALKAGDLSVADFRMLISEVASARDPNNSPVSRRFGEAMSQITTAVNSSPEFLDVPPAYKSSAILAWSAAVRNRMDEERQAGRNPANLFDPTNKDSVVKPQFIATFLNDARRQWKGDQQNAVSKVPKVGDMMTTPEGTFRYKGGDPKLPQSWEQASGQSTVDDRPSMILPRSGLIVRYKGEGDMDDLANWDLDKPAWTPPLSPQAVKYAEWQRAGAVERRKLLGFLIGE